MELLIILIICAVAAALSLIPLGKRFAPVVTLLASLVVFALAILAALANLRGGEVVAVRDWISCDSLSALILLLAAFVGLAAAIFSWGYINAIVGAGDDRKIRRYYSRFNLFLLSLLAIPLFSNVAIVWIAVELTTLFAVFLVSFESTPQALEAAWKFIVLTGMGAALALFGILLLYWGLSLAHHPGAFTWAHLVAAAPQMPSTLRNTAFLFILIGFGAKVGLVPLHTWIPEAYSQAPSPICTLLSGIETSAVLYCILRLLPLFPSGAASRAGLWFIVFGLISTGVAAFLMLKTKDFKRLFAFSTVEHMGIIMVGAGLGTFAAHFGAMLQIVAHSLTKSLCFFAAGSTLMATGTRNIPAIRGLIRISPLAGIFLMVGGLAIAGAPPFAVFLGEFAILKSGVASGQYLVIGLLALFIGVAFFSIMYQINQMVFGSPDVILIDEQSLFGRSTLPRRNILPWTCIAALVVTVIPVIVLGVYLPDQLYLLLHNAAAVLGGSR
ncbi:MAG: proton-conducting transporter membrane subunit [Deltaproteobacteria bacterium]|jgi:hydrogenase-4 component F